MLKKKILTINSMHTRFPLQVYARPDIMLSTEKCHKYKLKSYLKLTEDAIALSWLNFSNHNKGCCTAMLPEL